MTGHQIIGMFPAGERLDALEPAGDVLVLGGNIETEFVRGIIEVSHQRDIGDRGACAQDKGRLRQALVEDRECIVDAALEKREYLRMAGRARNKAQEPIRAEIAVDLLVVEKDPAQSFKPLIFACGLELA